MTTPREIIAGKLPFDCNDVGRQFAAQTAIEALTAAGYHIVHKDRFDAMHRRAQIGEGLLAAATQDLEMWGHCLHDSPKWFDTWLFRNALRRLMRLKDRAVAKAESATAGYHILSDAELAKVVEALEEALIYVGRYESENMSNVALATLTKGYDAIRAMKGGKP